MITYWIVFFLFAIIAYLGVGYGYAWDDFLKECFALQRPTMPFCWYVNFYVVFMLMLPLITKLLSKNIYFDFLISFVCIHFISRVLNHYIENTYISDILHSIVLWFPSVLIGYIFATYGFFEKLDAWEKNLIKNQKLRMLIWLLYIPMVLVGRYFETAVRISFSYLPSFYIPTDVIYAPLMIYALVNLGKCITWKYPNLALEKMGGNNLC